MLWLAIRKKRDRKGKTGEVSLVVGVYFKAAITIHVKCA